jgi:hypothetical protein
MAAIWALKDKGDRHQGEKSALTLSHIATNGNWDHSLALEWLRGSVISADQLVTAIHGEVQGDPRGAGSHKDGICL